MKTYSDEILFRTDGGIDIVDMTEKLDAIVKKSKMKNGLVCISITGSTGAITTMEYEEGLIEDFKKTLEMLVPQGNRYEHNLAHGFASSDNEGNGHSHVRASLMGPSITLPIKDGRLIHGTWQQIVFVELDTAPRDRKIIVQLVGE